MYVCVIFSAATFFCTYELVKSLLGSRGIFSEHSPLLHMVAASIGETVSKQNKINFLFIAVVYFFVRPHASLEFLLKLSNKELKPTDISDPHKY